MHSIYMASYSQMSSTVKQIIQGIKEEDEDEPWIPMEEKQSEIQLTEDSQTKGLPEEVPLTMQARGASPKLAIVQRMTSLDWYVEVKAKLSINLMANFFQ